MVARRTPAIGTAAAIAVCVMTLRVSAQITTGTISGTVKDAQGAVVPGAAVTLISDTRGTRSSDEFTNANGDFVFVNVSPDTYTVQVTMPGFKTYQRSGVIVTPGDRFDIGALTIDVGGLTETVHVSAESPLVQSRSGERSFTVDRTEIENLPIGNRSFTQLAFLAPGVMTDGTNTPQRIGGGGDPNVMLDGVSTMDTGSNRPLLQMNVESIGEIKVLTSGYQAEYGRASGVQVTAVTKSGTSRFRGSLYDVERNSDWNANSRVNTLNGDPKTFVKEKDWGYSIGGPVGRPSGNNKLFFFYAQEFSPRTRGNDVVRYRMPTALERAGDFSQTYDNNGNPYPYIKDPQLPAPCNSSNTAGCFRDGGVLGRIPADRLYQPGLNILKMWPLPNLDGKGLQYNYQLTRPTDSILSWQPAVRLDYQPVQKMRATLKYSAWQQKSHVFNGTIPGFNDTRIQDAPVYTYTGSVNYAANSTTFLEMTYGRSQNQLAGCANAQSGTGAIFCTDQFGDQGVPMTSAASLAGAGLQGLPFLFPNATVLNRGDYAVQALNDLRPAFWDGTRMSKVPQFLWGSRVGATTSGSNTTFTPPGIGFPGYFNINTTQDFSISVTKLKGRHNLKAGFYLNHSHKAENINGVSGVVGSPAFGEISFAQDAVGTNPFDTSFGFGNAAIGSFSSYLQAQRYVETASTYNNREGYVQDNWKITNKLTLDYGVRIVNQQAQYDELGQASNFLPDQWTLAASPVLFVAGCANNVYPCGGSNRQAMNPLTGQFLGPNSSSAIGTLVPNTGNLTDGLFLPGQSGVPKATYKWPFLVFGPRFGMAYDVRGTQRIILRGGAGLFFNRPSTTTISGGVNNPPTSSTVTVQYGQLQALSSGLAVQGAPALTAITYNASIPSSTQWNGGMQMALPWAVTVDLSYVGQHSFDQFQAVNINAVDFGTAFLPQFQDPSLSPTATPGATVVSANQMRPFRGYAAINQQWDRGWRTYHSIQLSFQRRFRNNLSFGFHDTMSLYDRQNAAVGTTPVVRLQHNQEGSYSIRTDQAQADALLGDTNPVPHTMRAYSVWKLPTMQGASGAIRALATVVNGWQLSGIWSGARVANFGQSNPTSAYTVGFGYQSGIGSTNLTGSPDYAARIRIVGNPGSGCSTNPYIQFNTAAFAGPLFGSVGLESGNGYLHGCFVNIVDLAIARNFPIGGSRNLQFRLDMFNAGNWSAVTGRNTTVNLNTANPTSATNLPYDPNGNLIVSRSLPRNAGFGVANNYQPPRTLQLQLRLSF